MASERQLLQAPEFMRETSLCVCSYSDIQKCESGESYPGESVAPRPCRCPATCAPGSAGKVARYVGPSVNRQALA